MIGFFLLTSSVFFLGFVVLVELSVQLEFLTGIPALVYFMVFMFFLGLVLVSFDV